jgi:hypothetical protein
MPLTLPSDTFESYAGDYAALDVVYDHFGTPLSNGAGVAHSGSWACQFDQDDYLLWPKGTWDGTTGRSEAIIDNTFWLKFAAFYAAGVERVGIRYLITVAAPSGLDVGCYVALGAGGWIGVDSTPFGSHYRSAFDALPHDEQYHKIRLLLELDGNGVHPVGEGVIRIWVDDALVLEVTDALLTVFGRRTTGGLAIGNGNSFVDWWFRVDDVNVVPVAGRARLWEVS